MTLSRLLRKLTDPMTAAILSIGTELTRGELINTNAAWLSEELTKLGFDVVEHAYREQRLTVKNKKYVSPDAAQLDRIGREALYERGETDA